MLSLRLRLCAALSARYAALRCMARARYDGVTLEWALARLDVREGSELVLVYTRYPR